MTPQRHSQFGQVQSEVDFVDNRPLQVQPPHLAAQMPQPGMDTVLKRTLRPVQLSTAASNQNLPQAPAAVDVGNFVLQAPVQNVAKSAEAVIVKGNACFLPLFSSLPQSTSTFPFFPSTIDVNLSLPRNACYLISDGLLRTCTLNLITKYSKCNSYRTYGTSVFRLQ